MSVNREARVQPWLVAFGSLFTVFHILPAFISYEIRNRLLAADLFDLLTPFVVVLLTYRIYRVLSGGASSPTPSRVRFLLILGAVTFVEGHGMHLSANAIGRHLVEQMGSAAYRLGYFFDEILGHLLWDSGTILLTAGFVVLGIGTHQKAVTVRQSPALLLSGAMFGFTYFANAVEGQTTPLTLPVAMLFVVWIAVILVIRRIKLFANPMLCFFLCGYCVALVLFCIWFALQGGLPQFSEVGWI